VRQKETKYVHITYYGHMNMKHGGTSLTPWPQHMELACTICANTFITLWNVKLKYIMYDFKESYTIQKRRLTM